MLNIAEVSQTVKGFDNVFGNLLDRHYKELKGSGIHDDVIYHNFKSVDSQVAQEILSENKIESFGKGQKTPHSSQHTTKATARTLERYKGSAGWMFSGLDPLTMTEMTWGALSPIARVLSLMGSF